MFEHHNCILIFSPSQSQALLMNCIWAESWIKYMCCVCVCVHVCVWWWWLADQSSFGLLFTSAMMKLYGNSDFLLQVCTFLPFFKFFSFLCSIVPLLQRLMVWIFWHLWKVFKCVYSPGSGSSSHHLCQGSSNLYLTFPWN